MMEERETQNILEENIRFRKEIKEKGKIKKSIRKRVRKQYHKLKIDSEKSSKVEKWFK